MGLIKQILHQGAVALLRLLLCSIPPRSLMRATEGIGALWFHLSRDRRRIAYENLRIAFGETISEAERRRIAVASFRHFGRALAELVTVDRLHNTHGRRSRRIRYRGACTDVQDLARRNQPGLLLTAHFGSWEVGSYAIQSLGVPLHVVVRTLDDPQMDAFITARRGGEERVIRKQGAVRGMLAAWRRAHWVAMLSDQNAGRHGVFVPFFGVPASTVPGPAVLSRRLDLPIFVGYCVERRDRPLHYDLTLERIPEAPPGLSDDEQVQNVMGRVHAVFERWIRSRPEQYNWSHRRWKTRPVDEEPGPRTPAYGARRGALRPRERAAIREATQPARAPEKG